MEELLAQGLSGLLGLRAANQDGWGQAEEEPWRQGAVSTVREGKHRRQAQEEPPPEAAFWPATPSNEP